jgi:hypothetical protein
MSDKLLELAAWFRRNNPGLATSEFITVDHKRGCVVIVSHYPMPDGVDYIIRSYWKDWVTPFMRQTKRFGDRRFITEYERN